MKKPRKFVPRAAITETAARAPRIDAERFRADVDVLTAGDWYVVELAKRVGPPTTQEQACAEALAQRIWLRENAAGFAAYNEQVERFGLFNEDPQPRRHGRMKE
jgi:hypothetical protein